MLKLYYSPAACSLAPHILLKELALEHTLVRVSTGDDEHRTAQYLTINPLGLLPTLEIETGERITEAVAILCYLAERAGGDCLPTGPLARARCNELLAILSSLAHPAYRMFIRPDRVVADPAAYDALRAAGLRRFREVMEQVELRLDDGGFALGETYTVADPYLLVMSYLARYAKLDFDHLPKIAALTARLSARPATLAALSAEKLIDPKGKASPPSRV